jgi:CubicO group peptidase (beta-lactamase class C family)
MTETNTPTVSVPAGGEAAGKLNGNPLTKEFGDFVKETLDEWKVPGMSIAVIDGGETYTEVGLLQFWLRILRSQ